MLQTASKAYQAAENWLEQFSGALSAGESGRAATLFASESFWRDHLAFTWNITTLEGRHAIATMLESVLGHVAPSAFELSEAGQQGEITVAWFDFETATGRAVGHLRLRNGKAWTLLTCLRELKGFEEKSGINRVAGVVHKAGRNRETWLEKRKRELEDLGRRKQPYCVIVGGGQGGIALAARLRRLSVPTLIVEKNENPGDSWRKRYRSLVLHDPVWYDHLPFLPFPDDWPVFTPKDKMGDWLEAYTKIMEIDYWGGTECLGAAYDSKRGVWQVTVRRDNETIVLEPQALVVATGAYGYPRSIDFPGADRFAGTMLHTSAYAGGFEFAGKRCAVIGSGSSAHDVCVDLWESGAQVTMIQRSPSIVVRSETLMKHGFAELYSEEAVAAGMTTDKADLEFASIPFRLMPQFSIPVYENIQREDAEFYRRLGASGFLYHFGEDGAGLLAKALRTASGYYIDVGASDLIINGDIAIASGSGVERLTETGIVLEDGRRIDCDVIVQATGYGSMDEMAAHLISPEVARRIGPFWGYGSGLDGDPGPWEGELRNMWKPVAQENLWFHGGNLALSRHYSLYVALQIKARKEGLPTPVYPAAVAPTQQPPERS
jgi:putative flavoprotein involved in K+ transport